MAENSHEELRSMMGRFLVDFVVIDNSIASLFSAAFGVRINCVEILYANIPLQARIQCLSSIAAYEHTTLDVSIRDAIANNLKPVKELQSLRNLLAHNIILDTDFVVRGAEDLPPNAKPGELFVWKTTRDGDYEIKRLTDDEIKKALQSIPTLAGELTVLCAAIRMRHGVRA